MEIQMIAMDLDGTALGPDHLTISPRLVKALESAHKKGIRIVPVTGRPFRLLPVFLRDHPVWESYAVLCNGALIRNLKTQELLRFRPLSRESLQRVLELTEQAHLPVELNAGGHLYLTRETLEAEKKEPRMDYHCQVVVPEIGILVDTLQDCLEIQVEKLHINCVPELLWPELPGKLQELGVSVVCEKAPNLEVTSLEATKGRGLQALCRHLHVPMEQVLAIGDSGNDLSMLQTAGISVAMGNAPEEIKQAAAWVTGTNREDGAAAAIERFALGSC